MYILYMILSLNRFSSSRLTWCPLSCIFALSPVQASRATGRLSCIFATCASIVCEGPSVLHLCVVTCASIACQGAVCSASLRCHLCQHHVPVAVCPASLRCHLCQHRVPVAVCPASCVATCASIACHWLVKCRGCCRHWTLLPMERRKAVFSVFDGSAISVNTSVNMIQWRGLMYGELVQLLAPTDAGHVINVTSIQ